jgi:hypothetical protein
MAGGGEITIKSMRRRSGDDLDLLALRIVGNA